MGCSASTDQQTDRVALPRVPSPRVPSARTKVDQSFDDIMCHSSHSAISDFVAPTRSVFPPARPLEVDQNLSPKSWTYDNIHVPEGMRIAAPPNRAMHDSHMRKLNAFLKAVHNKPESLHVAVGVKREVEDILTCIADGQ
ncbi:unnamed protein product [Cladocopium goreaui]|uniref:Uncharacterized protein n=1 Tax=Cladocopium goreaui TaxID=2562237 RepID=A0A9P1BVQ6_9DINO|nr:unnamed protein product [Cladocopium goreaui]|mmetsp:Transcript_4420/g.10249  ORF Transcript_4420/g.10249 Transcript_4420/m.10249 type:complete len:140 (+) Transcript_4420:113-532(+)